MLLWDKLIDIGAEWLQGRQEIGKARVSATVEDLKAKARISQTITERTFDLDMLAMKEASKSWWDEALCVMALYPMIRTGWETETIPELWVNISAMPLEYQILVMMIFVRYLGLRTELRMWLQSRKK